MTVLPKKTKRCKYCKRVLRGYNKSGICSACRNEYRFKLKDNSIADLDNEKEKESKLL